MGCYNKKCEKILIQNECTADANCTAARGGIGVEMLWDTAGQEIKCKSDVCKFTPTFTTKGEAAKYYATCSAFAEFGICSGYDIGEACDGNDECLGKQYCNSTGSKHCSLMGEEGTNCEDDGDDACQPGFFCDDNPSPKHCKTYNSRVSGLTCQKSEECKAGLICLGDLGTLTGDKVCKSPQSDSSGDCNNIDQGADVNANCYNGEVCSCTERPETGSAKRLRRLEKILHVRSVYMTMIVTLLPRLFTLVLVL